MDNGEEQGIYHRVQLNGFETTSEQFAAALKTARNSILAEMFLTDQEHLYIGGQGNRPEGWVFSVYGNDGYDVISDYTVNLEYLMTEPNKLSDKYENLYVR